MTAALRLFFPGDAPQGQTLDDVYRLLEPEYPTSMSGRSKVEHRTSLKHWREATGNPEISQVKRETVIRFRDALIGAGMSAATINKIWRTLRSMFRYAHDELKWIDAIPSVSYTMRSKLVDASDPVPRELLSHAEIAQLWANCLQARYPVVEPCLAWRTLLVMAWQYGMRTGDLVSLPRSAILLNQKLVRWAADKTSKFAGVASHRGRGLAPRALAGCRSPWAKAVRGDAEAGACQSHHRGDHARILHRVEPGDHRRFAAETVDQESQAGHGHRDERHWTRRRHRRLGGGSLAGRRHSEKLRHADGASAQGIRLASSASLFLVGDA